MALSDALELNTRDETLAILQRLYERGYRYVVREKEMSYLVCFSLKPKRFMELEIWGYPNVEASGVVPAYPIKNEDITEINWNNRSATLIYDFLTKHKEVQT